MPQMAAMADERGSLGAVALDGKVYALGGGKPKVQLAGVEMLDPNVNQWMKVKSMRSARSAGYYSPPHHHHLHHHPLQAP